MRCRYRDLRFRDGLDAVAEVMKPEHWRPNLRPGRPRREPLEDIAKARRQRPQPIEGEVVLRGRERVPERYRLAPKTVWRIASQAPTAVMEGLDDPRTIGVVAKGFPRRDGKRPAAARL